MGVIKTLQIIYSETEFISNVFFFTFLCDIHDYEHNCNKSEIKVT